MLGSPNASYGESSCKSTVEYMVDNCNKTPIIADTEISLITLTDGVITKPIQLMSEFLNEFGIEVVKAVITLFVVIDPIGIILFCIIY